VKIAWSQKSQTTAAMGALILLHLLHILHVLKAQVCAKQQAYHNPLVYSRHTLPQSGAIILYVDAIEYVMLQHRRSGRMSDGASSEALMVC